MNALKHGMTAKIALLPDESPDEFRERLEGMFDSLKPRDPYEVFLVERAVYSSWQLDRVARSESARLCVKACCRHIDEAFRVAVEVDGMVNRLFRGPFGRPLALPVTKRAEDAENLAGTYPGRVGDENHPKLLILKLSMTETGCQTLLHFWSELRAILENGRGWEAAERFRAFRLLGICPSNVYMTPELASILRTCQVLDAKAGSLVGEIWNEGVAEDSLPELEGIYQREICDRPPISREEGRDFLLGIIEREIEPFEYKAEQFAKKAELEAKLTPRIAAFDDSHEGELLRRYESMWERLLFRYLGELRNRRSEKAQRRASLQGKLPSAVAGVDQIADRCEDGRQERGRIGRRA